MATVIDLRPTEFKEWSFCKNNKKFYHNKCEAWVHKNAIKNNHIHCGRCEKELPNSLNYLAELGKAYDTTMFFYYNSVFPPQ